MNRPGSSVEHVVVVLPSFSIGESLLSHYATRIPALEHRYLLTSLMLHRIESCELVFLTCQAPDSRVLDYYASLLPPDRRGSARTRFRLAVVPDDSPRPIAAKLLDRPDLIAELRASFADRPAFIEPWNVTQREVEVAERLQVPIDGPASNLWHLGFKSSGRRLFMEAKVPLPAGRENVRTLNQVLAAITEIRKQRPSPTGVVVKLDDSGAGDGNAIIEFDHFDGSGLALPDWYVHDLASDAVVEELVTGTRFRSPSVQVELSPFGEVNVFATHEQVLGGDTGQVYIGCPVPGRSGLRVGTCPPRQGDRQTPRQSRSHRTAQRGFCGDPERQREVAHARARNQPSKGGTTHPYVVLSHLVPGKYDPEAWAWKASDGTRRWYWATDNLVDESWLGRAPDAVIRAVAAAGLQFDARCTSRG